MRFGIVGGFLPDHMADLTVEMCQQVRQLGFSGIFGRFKNDDLFQITKPDAYKVRDMLKGEGVSLFEATGYYPNLVTPDNTLREREIRRLMNAIKAASWMEARAVDCGPGSMNPDGPWFAHPDNWTKDAVDRLTDSLKKVAVVAEDMDVYLTIEGHQLVTLENATITAEVLDAVDSPYVRSIYDAANWIDRHTIFDTTQAINDDFDVLGKHIISAHAKDVWIENRHALHIQDGCPGKGILDFETLMTRLEALSPDYPLLVEGAESDELEAVGKLFHEIANKLNIRVLDARE
jgi:sugar phosphate isomerase/epimerase